MVLVFSCQPYVESIMAVLSCSCLGILKSTDFYHFATGVVFINLKQKGWHFICVKTLVPRGKSCFWHRFIII